MKDEIKEIKVNKANKSITFINNGIAFSQFGVADEILDLITNLQEKVNQYENPDDMTLMFMWCDEKAKDKIKQLKEELKSANESITWWSNRYKAIEHLYRYTPEKGFELVGDEE